MSIKDKKNSIDTLLAENAQILAELVVDPETTEATRIQILDKLVESKKNDDFFDTMISELMDFGACPHCGHDNYWLVPEDELNKRGIVTSENDNRVKANTTYQDCNEFQEACAKKKTTF